MSGAWYCPECRWREDPRWYPMMAEWEASEHVRRTGHALVRQVPR